jgi:S-adenosylmethionine hydrolase
MRHLTDISAGSGRSPVVLLTDFGADGFYAGAMKGAMLAVDPNVRVVDLTHSITPYAVDEASFVVATVFDVFPEGTVFAAVVDPGVGGPRRNLVLTSRGRYLVAPDNGIASDLDDHFGVDEVFVVTETAAAGIRKHTAKGRTFLGRDVFGPIAAFIAGGGSVGRVGEPARNFERIEIPVREIGEGGIRGHGRYADDFGNILTDISVDDLAAAFGSFAKDTIRVAIGPIAIDGVVESFSEVGTGEPAAVVNSWNRLEISVNQGSAVERLGVSVPVVVDVTRVKRG